MSSKIVRLRFQENTRERLDQYLARSGHFGSRSAARKAILSGRATVNGRAAKPGFLLKGGEDLEFEPERAEQATVFPEKIPLNTVYTDEYLMVVDKPAGMVVHPGAGHKRGTIANAVAMEIKGRQEGERPGIVHRLDKDTSGLLVVAKEPGVERRLRREIASRKVRRSYLALVHGVLEGTGIIDAPHGRHASHRQRFAVRPAGGKPAQTRFKTVAALGEVTLVECELVTGRTHQIRVHMDYIRHPLLGDKTYGRKDRYGRQLLHAYRLEFAHPIDGRKIACVSPLPEDFREALKELGMNAKEIKEVDRRE